MVTFRPHVTEALTPVDEVIAHLMASCQPGEPERLPVADCNGHVVAEQVVAVSAVPPFDNSSMDGFALRSDDIRSLPTRLTLRHVREAGDASRAFALAPGQCDAVMTGAPLPPGADAVVPFERVERHDDTTVVIADEVTAGAFVRRKGDDMRPGTGIASAGTWLTPQWAAAFVAAGVDVVLCHPQPRVAVITTGQEIAQEGPHSIPDSNSVYLRSALAPSFDVSTVGAVADDTSALMVALTAAAQTHDAIVTTGGVGPGARDLLPAAVGELGAVERVSVAMKPGKPFAFGHVHAAGRRVPVFCLPGNPVSAMVSLNVLVLPALRRLQGRDEGEGLHVAATTAAAFAREPDGKVHYVPSVLAYVGGLPVVKPLGVDSSHKVVSAGAANCLVHVPDGVGYQPQTTVDVTLL